MTLFYISIIVIVKIKYHFLQKGKKNIYIKYADKYIQIKKHATFFLNGQIMHYKFPFFWTRFCTERIFNLFCYKSRAYSLFFVLSKKCDVLINNTLIILLVKRFVLLYIMLFDNLTWLISVYVIVHRVLFIIVRITDLEKKNTTT